MRSPSCSASSGSSWIKISPSACSSDLRGNAEMLVMRTTEDPTDPIRKLISAQKSVRFHHLALAVNPLRLYGVEPRTLLRQQAAHDPYSIAAALFDFSVMLPEPAPDLPGDMPAS